MLDINYVTGDLFELIPGPDEAVVVTPHMVNNIGRWGSGFVIPLGKRFPAAEVAYREWHKLGWDIERNVEFQLGNTQIVKVAKNIYVANMIAQHGIISADNQQPIRYEALANCMETIAQSVQAVMGAITEGESRIEIHAPKFGSLRAGGDWNKIEELIRTLWIHRNIPVTIYSLENPI